jgi:predicted ATPase
LQTRTHLRFRRQFTPERGWDIFAKYAVTTVWRDQGKRDEARELLAPVYNWFTEGFDTRDLKEAKALLYEMA